jgi:acyl-coenzyme A synthetase/AMP-(fatty) acid ligase
VTVPAHLRAYRDAGVWRDATLSELALARADATPDDHMLVGSEQVTFGQLYEDAEALSCGLRDLGMTAGDRICFQLPNWRETAVINLAISMIGAVAVPIVPIYRDAELQQMLSDCGCRLIFLTESFRNFDYAAMADRIGDALPCLEHVIFVRGRRGATGYEALLSTGRGRAPGGSPGDPDAVKLLLYTSGTTGRPKGVLHSQNTINAVLDMSIRHWGISPGDLLLMPSPVTHLTGYGYLELPLLAGTSTVLMETWDAARAADLIDAHAIVGTVSATPFLKELADVAEAKGTRLPSLRFFACGGAAVPPAVIRHANAVFAKPVAFRIFGCSEAPLVTMGFQGSRDAELAATTDGAIRDYEVHVRDDEGRLLPAGGEGEILVRGPAMMLGYLDPEQTAAAIDREGFYATGDIGLITTDRAILITGRKKDLIIRGGENISAKEIEDVLHQHPAVAEAAVVAMPHERLGEGICAFVVPAGDAPASGSVLTQFVRQSGLAPQKTPEQIRFVPDLPRTPTGKVRKDVLRKICSEPVATGRGATNE